MLHIDHTKLYANIPFLISVVVIQSYEAEADNEYVIRGNSAVMTCEIPSYVAEFVFVDLWTDSDGGTYYPGNKEETGTIQNYFSRQQSLCLHIYLFWML